MLSQDTGLYNELKNVIISHIDHAGLNITKPSWYTDIQFRKTAELFSTIKNTDISMLDVGAGNLLVSAYFAIKYDNSKIIAIDTDKDISKLLIYLRSQYKLDNLLFIQKSLVEYARETSGNNDFNIIISSINTEPFPAGRVKNKNISDMAAYISQESILSNLLNKLSYDFTRMKLVPEKYHDAGEYGSDNIMTLISFSSVNLRSKEGVLIFTAPEYTKCSASMGICDLLQNKKLNYAMTSVSVSRSKNSRLYERLPYYYAAFDGWLPKIDGHELIVNINCYQINY